MSKVKTNAMRILDTNNVEYKIIIYDGKDGRIDGISVAKKIGKDLKSVFKTLVAQGNSGGLYVFIIPVAEELDLKKAAKVSGEKKIEMIPVKDITKHTGYIRGGCSPIGMKKDYPTFIDKSAFSLETIIISGGKIGVQIELSPEELQNITRAVIDVLVK
ncbi:Cys-tRNA(Pro) deacylase [Clostridium sp. Cult2]|nr:Cys-tRNA(Pro) deacylase [Clostridium sp. Cult2]